MHQVFCFFVQTVQLSPIPILKTALVELVPGSDSSQITGRITLVQIQDHVRIFGQIYGLNPGFHGFHVHAVGDTRDGCKAAGGHFNPQGNIHGAPSSELRHAGDVGNIFTPDYSAIT